MLFNISELVFDASFLLIICVLSFVNFIRFVFELGSISHIISSIISIVFVLSWELSWSFCCLSGLTNLESRSARWFFSPGMYLISRLNLDYFITAQCRYNFVYAFLTIISICRGFLLSSNKCIICCQFFRIFYIIFLKLIRNFSLDLIDRENYRFTN